MSITKIKCVIAIISIACLSACGANTNKTNTESNAPNSEEKTEARNPQMQVIKSAIVKNKGGQLMTLTGQILYQQIEGGFYGFIANNGDKYTLSGLKDEYRINGLIVELEVTLMPDAITTTQFGISANVVAAKVIDSSKVSNPQKSI